MLVSDSRQLVEQARFLATQARDPAPHYQHSVVGYNYRLSNLLAAVGACSCVLFLIGWNAGGRSNARYRTALGDLQGIGFMPVAAYGQPTHWLTCITIDPDLFGVAADEVRLHLKSMDIESRPTWKPLHLQPVSAACRVVGGGCTRTSSGEVSAYKRDRHVGRGYRARYRRHPLRRLRLIHGQGLFASATIPHDTARHCETAPMTGPGAPERTDGATPRVAIVLSTTSLGGASDAVELTSSAVAQGNDIRIVVLGRGDNTTVGLALDSGVPVSVAETVVGLVSTLRRLQPDAIFIFGLKMSLLVGLLPAFGAGGTGRIEARDPVCSARARSLSYSSAQLRRSRYAAVR